MNRRTVVGRKAGGPSTHVTPAPTGRGIAVSVLVAAITATMILIGMHSISPAWGHVRPLATAADSDTNLASPSDGSVGIRLVDIPAATADDPRTHEYIVDHVQPGDTITRRVEISNTTTTDLEVAVYASSAKIEHDTFRGDAGHAQNALTSWVSISETALTVPPGGTILDSVTVAIPADAAPGEQYGVIWAEVNGVGEGAVALVARTGIRVYLSVGGNNAPASNFTITGLTAERVADGTAAITGTVTNTGGRALDLAGTLNLAAVNGALTAGPYPVTVGTTLAPGDTGRVRSIISDDITNGPWTATLELHSGLVTHTATAEVTFPTKPAVSKEVSIVADPLPLVILSSALGAALIAVIVSFLIRRTQRRRAEPVQPMTPARMEAE